MADEMKGGAADIEEERDVVELVSLLAQVVGQVEDLESHSRAGQRPSAYENRAIDAARAALARRHATSVYADLAEIRERAAEMGVHARAARPAPREDRARDPAAGPLASQRSGFATTSSGEEPWIPAPSTPAPSTTAPSTTAATTSSLVTAIPGGLSAVRALADALVGVHEHDLIVDLVLRRVARSVPGADVVGLCLADHAGAPVAWTTTDPVVERVERAHPESPLRDAFTTGAGFCCPDLAREQRWVAHAHDALGRGLRGLVIATSTGASPRVGLVLYSHKAGVLDTSAVQTTALIVDLTRVALAGARRVAALNRALRSRDVIGQAKGFLAHRDGLDPEDAYARLVEASKHSNIKLVDVARWVVEQNLDGGQRR